MASVPYSYVAYIDEAGDPGLKRVKPRDNPGSSEWLNLAAIVVRAENEAKVVPWVRGILSQFKNNQRPYLHFTDLTPSKKVLVCSTMAQLPLRCFVVCSNKKNMRGYRNPLAEQYPAPNWFYAWLSRLLLERVTVFVREKSLQEFGEIRRVKLEFTERGGLTQHALHSYYRWLQIQSDEGTMVLRYGDLEWETMHEDLLSIYRHKKRAGLQLADAVASAFFKAHDCYDTGGCDPQFAKLLQPRMGRYPDHALGRISGYGVKLMPNMKTASLLPEQAAIFTYYGYPIQWWASALISPGG